VTEFANVFAGRTEKPSGEDLSRALGSAKPAWDRLLADIEARYGVLTLEWKCYSVKAGWSLRVLRGKRTVLWMGPGSGFFHAAVILGPKALKAMPADLHPLLEGAPTYPEGTAVRIQMRRIKDLEPIEKLVAVKMSVT
jgi:hypothetical protein